MAAERLASPDKLAQPHAADTAGSRILALRPHLVFTQIDTTRLPAQPTFLSREFARLPTLTYLTH